VVYATLSDYLVNPISPAYLPHISPYLPHISQVVYATLFDYIVNRVNDASRGPEASSVIGILDIFGFENLTTNSFEQVRAGVRANPNPNPDPKPTQP
jgi:hypothetical protein